MVSASDENIVKSEVASIKSETISVSGFSEYKDEFLKAEVNMEEPEIKLSSGYLNNILIKLDGGSCMKTLQQKLTKLCRQQAIQLELQT